jgi:hypothetical protein
MWHGVGVILLRNLKTGLVVVLACAVLLTGCGWISKSVKIIGVHASADGLTLEAKVSSCNAELSVDVREDYQSVSLYVTARNGADADCADVISIVLEDPLSSRRVIDRYDFTEVEVTQSSE